ncbi:MULTISPECIES: DUF4767 domain-containing protein [Enterococcus]|uniref:DUF4767 domain-containing protein n=1 Tax=Enterococcus TaxID=1350 RepID=UPI000EC93F25|nr:MULTISPECIES: DUF4767 domain-containing protein [Enterococcus]HCM87615.1 DUF4767 domain-containing protein [Enterococcus sp.]
MKKIFISLSVCIGLLSLAGCSKNETKTTEKSSNEKIKVSETYSTEKQSVSDTSSTEETISSSNDSSGSETIVSSASEEINESSENPVSVSNTIWDARKTGELQAFMKNWESVMGQSYNEYRPSNNVNYYGMQLPDDVLGASKRNPIAVNDTIVSAEWSDSGESASEYSIVSVYSDAQTAQNPSAGRHIYFFGFRGNQPVVLVSMQNQGMPDKALHFNLTENEALNSGFQTIAAGNQAE